MIIHKPEFIEKKDHILVSARIELISPNLQVPETLWFRYPKSYRDFITDRADGLIVGLLPTAMSLGENIEVKGDVSPRLAHGIKEYQQIQSAWYPEQFSLIDIQYHNLVAPLSTIKKDATGSSFSGGVDSFYSLWKHLHLNEDIPEYRITHCMIINGFDKDVDLENIGYFNRIQGIYEPLMNELGLNLSVSCTNLQKFRLAAFNSTELHLSFGVALTSSAMVLGNLFSRFYIPGSHTYEYQRMIPEGSHPILDHHLSTENLQVIHDGADATRVEKTAAISNWPVTHSALRVCFDKTIFDDQTGMIKNCCRCEKCIRTLITLELSNTLSHYKIFNKPLTLMSICRIKYISKGSRLFCRENIRLAGRKKRWLMFLVLHYAVFQGFLLEVFRPAYRVLKKIFKS